MANNDAAHGFIPLSTEGKEVKVSYYTKKTGAAIFKYDLVKQDATGTVTVGGTAGPYIGVAAEYKASADVSKIAVYDDPQQLFVAQCSADFALADVFQNADVVAGTGDADLLRSTHEVDSSSFGTTATLGIKILGLADDSVNVVGSYAKVVCKINNHSLAAHTGTVGV